MTLTLQCTNPTAQPEDHQWGLHGITLNAATWDGDWSTGLNPKEAIADDVVTLFAPNPEEVMNLHPMLCLAVDDLGGQTCSVMAMFDAASKKLSTFGLIRVGQWRELQKPAVQVESGQNETLRDIPLKHTLGPNETDPSLPIQQCVACRGYLALGGSGWQWHFATVSGARFG